MLSLNPTGGVEDSVGFLWPLHVNFAGSSSVSCLPKIRFNGVLIFFYDLNAVPLIIAMMKWVCGRERDVVLDRSHVIILWLSYFFISFY